MDGLSEAQKTNNDLKLSFPKKRFLNIYNLFFAATLKCLPHKKCTNSKAEDRICVRDACKPGIFITLGAWREKCKKSASYTIHYSKQLDINFMTMSMLKTTTLTLVVLLFCFSTITTSPVAASY